MQDNINNIHDEPLPHVLAPPSISPIPSTTLWEFINLSDVDVSCPTSIVDYTPTLQDSINVANDPSPPSNDSSALVSTLAHDIVFVKANIGGYLVVALLGLCGDNCYSSSIEVTTDTIGHMGESL